MPVIHIDEPDEARNQRARICGPRFWCMMCGEYRKIGVRSAHGQHCLECVTVCIDVTMDQLAARMVRQEIEDAAQGRLL